MVCQGLLYWSGSGLRSFLRDNGLVHRNPSTTEVWCGMKEAAIAKIQEIIDGTATESTAPDEADG